MPLQCQSAGSKHCLSAAVDLRGTAFKQQSQLFDTSPSHLSAQPSPHVKTRLPIKHSHKTLIHPLFRLYGLSSHNYPWSHNQRLILRLRPELRACISVSVCMPGKARGRGGRVRTEVVPQTCASKNSPFIYRQAGSRRHEQGAARSWGDACMSTHKHRSLLATHRLSVAFLSLPLAVSQIPDDVLTGGWVTGGKAVWWQIRAFISDQHTASLLFED